MKYIAIVGMPRSGTTVVSAYLNSQPGALVIGEPHSIEKKAPSREMSIPYHVAETQYGILAFYKGMPIMDQIKAFAQKNDVSVLGFKEAWIPRVDPIQIIESYCDWLDRIIVVLREPRRTYNSISQRFTQRQALEPVTFEEHWKALYRYGATSDRARFVILDQFRQDPAGSLRRASGLDIQEIDNMLHFPGDGDPPARAGGKVKPVDRQEKSEYMFPRIKRMYRLAVKVAERYE
jgi:hypothetical protein